MSPISAFSSSKKLSKENQISHFRSAANSLSTPGKLYPQSSTCIFQNLCLDLRPTSIYPEFQCLPVVFSNPSCSPNAATSRKVQHQESVCPQAGSATMQRLRRKRCSLFSLVPKRVSQVSTAHAVHVSLWSEMTNATLLSICACHPGTYEWAPQFSTLLLCGLSVAHSTTPKIFTSQRKFQLCCLTLHHPVKTFSNSISQTIKLCMSST